MQLTPDGAGDDAGLTARVFAGLDRRLRRDDDRPVALALSGGGDSIALLRLAAAWAGDRGRPLLALTVDHGLNPRSPDWTRFAGEAARAVGADWRPLVWAGEKPTTGLTAVARSARHRLIAEAARAAGARVVLFAHTADDVAEADLMRAEGATLGRVREWSPSPAWPEGRGLLLLRPLLGERRETLRAWLADQKADWIEDPANVDPRFGRSRARLALAGTAADIEIGPEVEIGPEIEIGPGIEIGDEATGAKNARPFRGISTADDGTVRVSRNVEARALAAALVCVGGGATPPRGDRLTRLLQRLGAGEDFAATLCGARVEASGGTVVLMREAGEFVRRPSAPVGLAPGVEAVWDGRFVFLAQTPGWSVVPARGCLSALSSVDRSRIGALPVGTRGAFPVLIRDVEAGPVLADPQIERRELVSERVRLALDETTHEDDLNATP
ncbi:tRNA lysidine(34) synthetase TilS [Brevundimonas sp. SL130]|uniref:tRNA lysidine(34) synthetase TilS n=1 Tax=Brevundimonas sp. SL130 TaxID=2995143 RepID=UPI00226CC5B7|nr:tRNA lysidine(34) synthetase TilS [Brevundimonas sp. SL130]WAC60358.1 tRNA lysidine(34) synthetase TilS [Brevundimonas sp. SL130]